MSDLTDLEELLRRPLEWRGSKIWFRMAREKATATKRKRGHPTRADTNLRNFS